MNLNDLNAPQREAAETLSGPVLVLAGAGSGKTKMLTYRVANLLEHGVSPYNIMAITFTNKAAAEMKKRIEALVGPAANELWISTFHSSCARILRKDIDKLGYNRSFSIYDDDDQMRLLKGIYKETDLDPKYLEPRSVLSMISDAKGKCLNPNEWFEQSSRTWRDQKKADLYTSYEEAMRKANALDFNDLIIKTLELMVDHPPVRQYYRNRLRYIHVDEYQDTDHAQFELIRQLVGEEQNICVVGDDDQSIYSWRGADISNILDFEKFWPNAHVVKLEQNYRSSANILNAANQVIAENENRKDKALWTNRGPGEPLILVNTADERDEAYTVASEIRKLKNEGERYGNNAILYRTNAQSRVLEEQLIRQGIPYRIYGGLKFYDRLEIKDIMAYLRVMINPADNISFERILNVPKRGIGDSTVDILKDYAEENGMSLFEACMSVPGTLGSRARKQIVMFNDLMMSLSMRVGSVSLEELVEQVIEETGLLAQYKKEQNEENISRIENIQEFLGSVHDFCEQREDPTLQEFIENVSLVTSFDKVGEDENAVILMTLHGAKGLEFPNVFLVGMEENIFPSSRSCDDEDKLEEERRLCYVGITRAQNRLYLTYAEQRKLYNNQFSNLPSRFLESIPEDLKDYRMSDALSGDDEGSFRSRAFAGSRNDLSNRRMWNNPQQGGFPGRGSRDYSSRGSFGGRSASDSYSQYGEYARRGAAVNAGNNRAGSTPVQRGTENAPSGVKLGGSVIPGVTRGFPGKAPARGIPVPQKTVVVRSAAALQDESWRKGDRIRHRSYGEGTVLKVTERSYKTMLTVKFESAEAGIKELDAAVAPILKIE